MKKALRGSAGNCQHKNTDFALCARQPAVRAPRGRRDAFALEDIDKAVYWNGTHLSVFEFRVEKELGYDLDAAGASV
jgi:hypothetical protein